MLNIQQLKNINFFKHAFESSELTDEQAALAEDLKDIALDPDFFVFGLTEI